jgi:beta-galactosidase
MTGETAALLAQYVQLGGTVVFGCRTGYKDIQGQCPMRPFPGPVADLCGVTVEEFTRILPNHKEPTLQWKIESENHGKLGSGPFNDVLKVESASARVIAAYGQDAGHYAGKPALVENAVGAGRACYFGGVFTEPVARAIALHLGLPTPAADVVTVPPDVELAIRENESGARFLFLLNYAETAKSVVVHTRAIDLITGQPAIGELSLGAYGVAVLRV